MQPSLWFFSLSGVSDRNASCPAKSLKIGLLETKPNVRLIPYIHILSRGDFLEISFSRSRDTCEESDCGREQAGFRYVWKQQVCAFPPAGNVLSGLGVAVDWPYCCWEFEPSLFLKTYWECPDPNFIFNSVGSLGVCWAQGLSLWVLIIVQSPP